MKTIYGLSTEPIAEEQDTPSDKPVEVPAEGAEQQKIDIEVEKVVDEEE